MIEHLIIALLGSVALGLITWQYVRVIANSDVFEPVRSYLRSQYEATNDPDMRSFYRILSDRLAFGQTTAWAFTWTVLLAGLLIDGSVLPPLEWVVAFGAGPFLVGAWHEIIRRVEAIAVPE